MLGGVTLRASPWVLLVAAALGSVGCGTRRDPHVLTFAGSAVGAEAVALRAQLDRFQAAHPAIRVELRSTPDAADQRHQLYVQWLNAHAPDPDVLQLDVVWTAEFAAAGWIRQPRSISAGHIRFLSRRRGGESLARCAVCAYRGSWTSACSTGGPI